MKNFEYIAVSSNWKKQSWFVEANDEIEAKWKLHDLWFSVLRIFEKKEIIENKEKEKKEDWKKISENEKKSENKKEDNLKSSEKWERVKKKLIDWLWISWKWKNNNFLWYEFHWIDSDWSPIWWTIEASNEVFAYKRLITEFHIKPEWIVLATLSPAIKWVKKENSIKEIIELAYDEWIEISAGLDDIVVKSDSFLSSKEEKEQLWAEILTFLPRTLLILEEYKSFLVSIKVIEIKKKIWYIEKIKRSNNLLLVQSELNELLNDILKVFTPVEKERINKKDSDFLLEISTYLWYEKNTSFLVEWLSFLFKGVDFLKPFIEKIKEKTDILKANPEINQQKQKVKRYFWRSLYHFKFIFLSSWKDRVRRIKAFKKSLGLVFITYQNYNGLLWNIVDQKTKFKKRLIKWQKWFYLEFRSFTWWLFWLYFLYFAIIEISIKKWLFLPVQPSFWILNSRYLITFIFIIFFLNILLKFKIKYFLKSKTFNYISLFCLSFAWLLFFNNF